MPTPEETIKANRAQEADEREADRDGDCIRYKLPGPPGGLTEAEAIEAQRLAELRQEAFFARLAGGK